MLIGQIDEMIQSETLGEAANLLPSAEPISPLRRAQTPAISAYLLIPSNNDACCCQSDESLLKVLAFFLGVG